MSGAPQFPLLMRELPIEVKPNRPLSLCGELQTIDLPLTQSRVPIA